MLGPLVPPWYTLNTTAYTAASLPHAQGATAAAYCAATGYGAALSVYDAVAVVGAPAWIPKGGYPHFQCSRIYDFSRAGRPCVDTFHDSANGQPLQPGTEFPFIGTIYLFHKRSQPSGPCVGMAADDAATACWHSAGALHIPKFTHKELEAIGFTPIMLQHCAIPLLEYGKIIAMGNSFIVSAAELLCEDGAHRGFIMFIHHLNGSLIDYYGEWFYITGMLDNGGIASEPRLDRFVHSTFRFFTNKDRDRWGDLFEQSHSLVISRFDPSGKPCLAQPFVWLLPSICWSCRPSGGGGTCCRSFSQPRAP